MKNKKQNSNGKAKQNLSTDTQSADQLPGYPLYPSSEDIMNRGKRLNVDLDVLENSQSIAPNNVSSQVSRNVGTSEQNSDLTEEDFQALGSDEIQSEGDDEILLERTLPVDFAGADLDVPGSEQDDEQEEIGSEDEENNAYSLGGDNHTD